METPERTPFPVNSYNNLTSVRKLLLLRCFRVDRVFRAMQDYVSETMGSLSSVMSSIRAKYSKKVEKNHILKTFTIHKCLISEVF